MKELCKEADVSDPEVYEGVLPTGALQHAVINRIVDRTASQGHQDRQGDTGEEGEAFG